MTPATNRFVQNICTNGVYTDGSSKIGRFDLVLDVGKCVCCLCTVEVIQLISICPEII